MTASRLRLLLAALLILSAAAFAVGSAIERSHTHESAQPTTESSPSTGEAGGGEGTGGETATPEPASHVEQTVSSETLLGINPESTALVAVGVAVSLLLAAGVWFWGHRPVLVATLLLGVAFGALDIREALHQSHESRTGLMALAIGLAILHGAVAVVAGAALLQKEAIEAMA